MDFVVSILIFLLGMFVVGATLFSAVRTFVLPRGDNNTLTRLVFLSMFRLFSLRLKKVNTYEQRDSIMALFAPITLLALPVFWLILIILGYTLMFWAIGVRNLYEAFKASGSSLFTLGFFTIDTFAASVLTFTEATLGLGIVALLLAYLPTMYAAFARRETLVTLLEIRADSPPSAVAMITRAHRIRGLDYLKELWESWEIWFADIDESHTSLAPINFFRSPQPGRSWVTAAGAVLDAASLMNSAVNIPMTPEAQLCIRAGYVALRHICSFFRIEYHPEPHFPDQPISISRQEFEEALDQMAAEGVPIKADRDQAWLDFAGWRVNYDTVLLELAELLLVPYAPWSSDRGLQRVKPARRNRLQKNGVAL